MMHGQAKIKFILICFVCTGVRTTATVVNWIAVIIVIIIIIIIILSVHEINPYVEWRNGSTQSLSRPSFEVNGKLDGTAALETSPDSRKSVPSGEVNACEKTMETLAKSYCTALRSKSPFFQQVHVSVRSPLLRIFLESSPHKPLCAHQHSRDHAR